MKENKKLDEFIDEIETGRTTFEGVPVAATVQVKRCRRSTPRSGLPEDELEKISAMRLWAPLAGIPQDPHSPDDFEPALPDSEWTRG